MSHSHLARRAKYRAIFFGAFMAIVVFGGAIVYFQSERPTSYRGEGGDHWVFARYQESTNREALSALRKTFSEKPGSWGAELLREPNGRWLLLSRWGNKTLWKKVEPESSLSQLSGFMELWEGTIEER